MIVTRIIPKTWDHLVYFGSDAGIRHREGWFLLNLYSMERDGVVSRPNI